MGSEIAYNAVIVQHLDALAAAFVSGDPGMGQWLDLGLGTPPQFFSPGNPGDNRFLEAELLTKKFERTSTELRNRIGVLQEALRGVSGVSTDVRKALAAADYGAVDAAMAKIPTSIDDPLKRPKPLDEGIVQSKQA